MRIVNHVVYLVFMSTKTTFLELIYIASSAFINRLIRREWLPICTFRNHCNTRMLL